MHQDKLAAVVFDLDGLMVDTEPLAREAWRQVLVAYGRSLDDDLFAKMIGLRLEDSTMLLIRELGLSVAPADLAQKESESFFEIMKSGVATMPGLHTFLETLQRYDLPWAVATSSGLVYAKKVLSMIGLLESCRSIAAGDEVQRGKPHPELYLLASQRLGVEPHSCLALEDSAPGCQAAKAAGMLTIAVPSPLAADAEYPCADLICSSLEEAAEHLEKILQNNWGAARDLV